MVRANAHREMAAVAEMIARRKTFAQGDRSELMSPHRPMTGDMKGSIPSPASASTARSHPVPAAIRQLVHESHEAINIGLGVGKAHII